MKTNTYKECANDFELWAEYVDPDGTVTEEEFEKMTEAEKIKIQIDCFGPEEIDYDDYEIVGYRFIDRNIASKNPEVGDELRNSSVWEGDERTDEELPGTCAFYELSICEKYAQWSKGQGWIVVIGGGNEGYGDLAGEILVSDATILKVTEW